MAGISGSYGRVLLRGRHSWFTKVHAGFLLKTGRSLYLKVPDKDGLAIGIDKVLPLGISFDFDRLTTRGLG
jgi:hypothetical protein